MWQQEPYKRKVLNKQAKFLCQNFSKQQITIHKFFVLIKKMNNKSGFKSYGVIYNKVLKHGVIQNE